MPRRATNADVEPPGDLDWALPPVRAWFAETFGEPTPAQRGGWPSIARGQHTLICAPTGTGKTLAAFLACLDRAWRANDPGPGTRILYVSPLKALNRDVAINLEAPLAGIVRAAGRSGTPLRPLTVGVRTGDTTAAERRAQARRPPDVLITTPESLHLLLSSGSREGLRAVTHVVVDEIHDLCSSKRGASLALLLERLDRQCPSGFVRIGLSATLKPLEDVARFLGGWRRVPDDRGVLRDAPRPVAIVDAGVSKRLEVTVASATSSSGPRGGTLEAQLLGFARSHRPTLIFANNRAEVERLTSRLNARAAGEAGDTDPGEVVRAHHGSLSLDRRREAEDALRRGEVSAVVATASLELGIDVGAIDLVCQVGSPGGVARGLQRVGRAGHSAGATSRARLFGRNEAELLELAALAGAMRDGAVEPVRIPRNCLDVLAQQVVACVAVEPWDAAELFDLIRRADPFRTLPIDLFESVVAMLSGRSDLIDVRDLRPRIRWDRVANRLEPLPGTRRHALMGGNTIPDTGQFPVYLEGGPRLGEFDEAFVLERRPGDTVQLGTSTWVIRSIDAGRVTVAPAEGRAAVVPFWRGEGLGRSSTLGNRVGALRREVAGRLGDPGLPGWLVERFAVDPDAARAIVDHVALQVRSSGAVPDDRTVLVESFLDQAGIANLAILTPFGSRFHLGLKLVLLGRIRDRFGIAAACQHADDGLVLQFPGLDAAPDDLLGGLSERECEALLVRELRDNALFGLRFRQVAGRALLLSRTGSASRTPLWYQRLRAEELLARLETIADHPLIVETIRECLQDDLDLPLLRAFVRSIGDGSIVVRHDPTAAMPSPLAASLARSFSDRHVDRFERRSRRRAGARGGDVPPPEPDRPDSFTPWVDPDAVHRVESRLRGLAQPPRSAEEMAELLRFCGDLTSGELTGTMNAHLAGLAERGVAVRIRLASAVEPDRWILVESLPVYQAAFGIDLRVPTDALAASPPPGRFASEESALEPILRTYLRSHALVGAGELAGRYGIDSARARRFLKRFVSSGDVVAVGGRPGGEPERWGDRRNLEDVRRISVALRRKEAVAVEPDVFADLLVRHQHAHPGSLLEGREGLEAVLRQWAGYATIADLWESEILPRRVAGYVPARLDELLRTGGWVWRQVDSGTEPSRVAIIPRDFGGGWPVPDDPSPLSGEAGAILEILKGGALVESDELGTLAGLESKGLSKGLAELSARGLVGGDHFDPIRRAGVDRKVAAAGMRMRRTSGRPASDRRRGRSARWESSGVRWSALPAEAPAGGAMAWALAMLDRFGILCRETAGLEPWAPPWSVLRSALDAAELRGEVRRGYFVAGLSGVQFALEPFADRLSRHRPGDGGSDAVLLSTLDPANLYGSGGPIDLPPPARLARGVSNHLVLMRGRPVLLSEGFARRLNTLPWANDQELGAALATLVRLAGPSRRIVKVQSIDGRPALQSRHAERLIDAGFVRDPPGLAFYAGW